MEDGYEIGGAAGSGFMLSRAIMLSKSRLFNMPVLRIDHELNIKADYPMAQCYLLYGGEHQRDEAGISILPIQQGFQQLVQILSLPPQNNIGFDPENG